MRRCELCGGVCRNDVSGITMEAVFRVDHNEVETRPHAGGPWHPTMQHGGASSALVVWAAERIPTPQPMHVARLTVDLMRPVPVAPLTIAAEVVREGRKIQLCSVRLLAEGVEVARASVLKVRARDMVLPDVAGVSDGTLLDVTGPETGREDEAGSSSRFIRGLTLRAVRGGFLQPGPGAIWFRVDRPMIEGAPTSAAMRAAVAADCGNGVSSVLDITKWTFLNADLTVSFARPPVGDWILLNSQTILGRDGAALAMSRLADVHGYFGCATQSLVVEPR
jgi:acyl-coenzyme A thioesterase PaaI-like protein